MWIKFKAVLCCVLATSLATKDTHLRKNDDKRNKRTLEYSISHDIHHPTIERRASYKTLVPPPVSLFSPIQRPYNYLKNERFNYLTPPYEPPIDPLVQYPPRDFPKKPLSQPKGAYSHVNNVYGYPPVQQVERPVYIKEPEPIIEIIIKESNITLPPDPVPIVTVPPPKKEQVQVFYVKYQKNPHGTGKDSIIYDKPIPALSPHVPDDNEYKAPPVIHYENPIEPTQAPLPSTTLRAIIKPDSETYHADKNIHITFGKTVNDNYKRSNDNHNQDSAPSPSFLEHQEQPSNDRSQARQFISPISFGPESIPPFVRKPSFHSFPNNFSPFHSESFRSAPPIKPPDFLPTNFKFNSFSRPPSQTVSQFSISSLKSNFAEPPSFRQPVAYKPFEDFRIQGNPSPPQFQFPKHQTHFPIQQHLPQIQPHSSFNSQHPPEEQHHLHATQLQFQNNLKNEELIRQQHFTSQIQPQQPNVKHSQQHFSHHVQPQKSQPIKQQNAPPQFSQPLNIQHQIHQQHSSQQQFLQQQQQQQNPQHSFTSSGNQETKIIPPGGELIPSVTKYEQHILVPDNSNKNIQIPSQQYNINQQHRQVPETLPPHQNAQINFQQPQNNNQQFQLTRQASSNQLQQLQQQQQIQLLLNQQQQQQQEEQQRQIKLLQQLQQQTQQTQKHPEQVVQPQLSSNIQRNPINPQLSANLQEFQPDKESQNYDTEKLLRQHYENQLIQSQLQTKLNSKNQVNGISYSPPATTPSSVSAISSTTAKTGTNDFNIELPDEVPDDLRQQLLSSGILKNAQISVLDYDKIGDTPLSSLPADQLANFFSAGGGQQLAASEQQSVILTRDGKPVKTVDAEPSDDLEMEGSESKVSEIKMEPPLEMKVVHYNPDTEQGQKVQNSYLQEGATQVDPVALNDQQYTRYLPIKVNGATFPIPDVPELRSRNITSVVILAPVDYSTKENQRPTRDINVDNKDPRFSALEALRKLLMSPSEENYKNWLDKENKTISDKQAVVLLVTGDSTEPSSKEIFMYDIATQSVNKLSGELSSAFVEAAETNSNQNVEKLTGLSSLNAILPYAPKVDEIEKQIKKGENLMSKIEDEENMASESIAKADSVPEASEQIESFVDLSGAAVKPKDFIVPVASEEFENRVIISSGYSKTGSNLLA